MNRYTNFILTVIAVAMLGILFKGEINNPAEAGVGWGNASANTLRNFVIVTNNGLTDIASAIRECR